MAKAQETAQSMAEKGKEMGAQVLQKAEQVTSGPMRAAEQVPSRLYMGAVLGSILASAGLFLSGRTMAGIFVGLWAPTFLNLAVFNRLLQPSREPMTGRAGYAGQAGTGAGAYGGTTGGAS